MSASELTLEDMAAPGWLSELEAMERGSPKGWSAKYQPRCDCCGRFVLPGSPGSSWVNVPSTDMNAGDERERCAACTTKHGAAQAMPGYVKHLVQGVVPEHPTQTTTNRAEAQGV